MISIGGKILVFMEIIKNKPNVINANERAIKIFKFLKAIHDENYPIITDIKEENDLIWFDLLPVDSNLKLPSNLTVVDKSHTLLDKNAQDQNVILEITRPQLKPCPAPNQSFREYLPHNYDDINLSKINPKEFLLKKIDGIEYCECLHFNLQALTEYNDWLIKRNNWYLSEIGKLESYKLFEKLFTLYAKIQKEGENLELVVANAFIAWRKDYKTLNYPLIFQTVTLKFIPAIPKFQLVLNDNSTNLYEQALTSFTDISLALEVNSNLFTDLYKEIKAIDNVVNVDASIFKTFIQTLHIDGQILNSIPSNIPETPGIYFRPVFMIRNRQSRLSDTFAKIISAINNNDTKIPASLKKIIGIHDDEDIYSEEVKANTDTPNEYNLNYISIDKYLKDILLTKPYNIEQIQIIEYLKSNSAVLIQGPPGTGKTHTIANLIGHFLAKGKTVLVTAHTSKALQVIRDKVVGKLQPLCVSLLNNDLESRNLLSESISAIIDKITLYSGKTEILQNEIDILNQERDLLIDNISDTKKHIYDARISEYGDLFFNKQKFKLAQAAHFLNQNQDSLGFITGSINTETSCEFSQNEFQELLQLNETISTDMEVILIKNIDLLKVIPKPQDFNLSVTSVKNLEEVLILDDNNYLLTVNNLDELDDKLKIVNSAISKLNQLIKILADDNIDARNQLILGLKNNLNLKPLDDFLENAKINLQDYKELESKIIAINPRFDSGVDFTKAVIILNEIIKYLEDGKTLNLITLITKPAWQNLLKTVWIDKDKPKTIDDFKLLFGYAEILTKRNNLLNWFNRLIAAHNVKIQPDNFNEEALIDFTQNIKFNLGWQNSLYEPILNDINQLGLNFPEIDLNSNLNPNEILTQLSDNLNHVILSGLNNLVNQLKLDKLKFNIINTKDKLLDLFDSTSSVYINNLILAIDNFEANEYQLAYHKIAEVLKLQDKFLKRKNLISKLHKWAPDFAKHIEERKFQGDASQLDFAGAYNWSVLNKEFNNLAKNDINLLQDNLVKYQEQLAITTEKLVELKTWSYIVKNISAEQRQSLIGWYDITRKIGKGYGKRVAQLRSEANRLLIKCKEAVPVWIMPMARIPETFDVVNTKFDVLIIDEASQSDLNALISLYMSKYCIIVGDHEQISPSAIGQEVDSLNRLIDTYLDEIPNKVLYDGKTSVYDIARQSFPVSLCLKEHFRCLPEIIEFSNNLCYEGKIKPLKDSSLVNIKPPLVGIRVLTPDSELTGDNVNIAECYTITALILACLELEQYNDKTFGVISLLGSEQTNKIEKLLRNFMPPTEYETRKILCGNSAIFQGDERDVIMLSMVDIPQSSQLRIKDQSAFKQRYNVAASRASEQLWVVHSLDPNLDLKSGDLRSMLLNHVYSYDFIKPVNEVNNLAKKIYDQLLASGFIVIAKYIVGYFEIDLVVELKNVRIALQIDGDEVFIQEKFTNELEKQFILQRLGWKFLIIQASNFNYDFNKAFNDLVFKLNELDTNYSRLNQLMAVDNNIDKPIIVDNLIDLVKIKAKTILKDRLNYNYDVL